MGSWSICTVLDNEGILSPSEYNRFRRHNPDMDSKFVRKRFWIKIICGTSCKVCKYKVNREMKKN